MSYTPNNQAVFIAAFSGALSGMTSGRTLTNPNPTSYDVLSAVAGAFAQEFDTIWGSGFASTLQIELIEKETEGAWEDRIVQATSPFLTPATYTNECIALIATMTSAMAYFTSQGISPNTPIGPPNPATFQTDHFIPTLGQTAFTLSGTPFQTNQVLFNINGVTYENTIDFTVSGLTLTWGNSFALHTSDHAFAFYEVP